MHTKQEWASNYDIDNRFRDDTEIREYGFEIYSRPKEGDILWIRYNRVYTQSQVEEMIISEAVEKVDITSDSLNEYPPSSKKKKKWYEC